MDQEVNASPEEQQLFDQATAMVDDLLFGEGPLGDQVAKIVAADKDVMIGIGKATATVLLAVEQKMQIPEDMKLPLAQEIVEDLADMAVKVGAVGEDEITEDTLKQIVDAGTAEYLRLADATGKLDHTKLQQDIAATQQEMAPQPEQETGLF